MILVIEGLDSSGKETQTKILVERLCALGIVAHRGSFPDYTTGLGEIIRALLTDNAKLKYGDLDYSDKTRAEFLQAIQTVNRYEHYDTLRDASVRDDFVLVLDRYWLSGLAYGQADGLDKNWLLQLHEALPAADLTIFLDIEIEESFRRRPERQDRYEANRSRLEAARNGYLEACKDGRAVRVSGHGTVEDVSARIWSETESLPRLVKILLKR